MAGVGSGRAREDSGDMTAQVEGRLLRLTSLDRLLWPAAGFTKGQMIEYYRRIAAALLPHIADRPLTLGRFPEGVEGRGFAQTECRGRPGWMPTVALAVRGGKVRNYCLVNDLPALLWIANLAAIELHPFLATATTPQEPTHVIFDLDPGPPAGLGECCAVALSLRGHLEALGLTSFPKTSGGAGLHVYVPLHTRAGFDETKCFARRIARSLARRAPDVVVDKMPRSLRPGRVFVDWSQNDPRKSTVAPYSLRAADWPMVSTPVTWREVEAAASSPNPDALLRFHPTQVIARIEANGDLFAQVSSLSQPLPVDASSCREDAPSGWT